ncbi:MAG: hypothetical protein R2850_11655 [Bacteroidia bacterium]
MALSIRQACLPTHCRYNKLYNADNQSFFDKNLREALGLSATGTDWIDIDNLDPSTFSLSMFSPDELLNQKVHSTFLITVTTHMERGEDVVHWIASLMIRMRTEISSVSLERLLLYIWQLTFRTSLHSKRLIFNIGLRVDRYDANQSVLKDPYSLYETRKAGEFVYNDDQVRPSNIGDDYVVYARCKEYRLN